MDLTLQVPMQYCSQQHDFTFTIRHIHSWALFLLWPASSFLLELILLSSPVAYWTPANLGGSSFSVIYFCLFILLMEFSKQERWSDLPIPSPVDHVLSELSTTTCASCLTRQGSEFCWVRQSCDPHDKFG